MYELMYIYDGNVVSKEEYLQKIGFAGYEEIFDKIQKTEEENHKIDYLYLIQLFDYNCPSCTSGVTNVFVEDIEEFAKTYQSIEKDKSRVERFLRSKAGEIVTDYYSEDPTLNIVQKVKVEDFGYILYCKRDVTLSIANGYGWPADYFFGMLVLGIHWIKFQGRYYKLAKPYGRDCYEICDYDVANPKRSVFICGNPFWLSDGTNLESYVWQVADIFDTEEEMMEDRKLMSKGTTLSEIQMNRVFADIPGEAG